MFVVSLFYHHILHVYSTAYRASHREVTSVKTIRWPGVGVGFRHPSAARSATGIRPKLIFFVDIITTPCHVLVFARAENSIVAQVYKPFSHRAKTTLWIGNNSRIVSEKYHILTHAGAPRERPYLN